MKAATGIYREGRQFEVDARKTTTEKLGNTVRKSTDDSFQSKVDEAGAGGVVIFEPGDHGAPSSTVTLPSATAGSETTGIMLMGYGKNTRVKCLQNDWTFEGTTRGNYDTDDNISGHVIEDIFFYQDDWTNHGQGAVHFDGALQSRVEGCWFKHLLYGIKDEATNGNSWANKYHDNDFEVVQRPIWLDGVHDPSVKDNHSEGISAATSISSFDDTEGPATGIGLIGCTNGTVGGNEMENMNDDGGEGKGYFLKNHNRNLQMEGNYDEGTDRPIVIHYSANPSGGVADLNLSNNHGDIDAQGESDWSAGSTHVGLYIHGHNGVLTGVGGTVDSITLHVSDMQGGGDINLNPFVSNTDARSELQISGCGGVSGSTAQGIGIFIKGFDGYSINLNSNTLRYAVIEENTDTTDVGDVTVVGNTVLETRVIVRDAASLGRLVAIGNTQTTSTESEFIEVGANASITDFIAGFNVVEASSLLTNNGTITNQRTDWNIVAGDIGEESAIANLTNNMTSTTTNDSLEGVGDTSAGDESAPIERNFSELEAKVESLITALENQDIIST